MATPATYIDRGANARADAPGAALARAILQRAMIDAGAFPHGLDQRTAKTLSVGGRPDPDERETAIALLTDPTGPYAAHRTLLADLAGLCPDRLRASVTAILESNVTSDTNGKPGKHQSDQ